MIPFSEEVDFKGKAKPGKCLTIQKLTQNAEIFHTKYKYQKFIDKGVTYMRGIFCSKIENEEKFNQDFGDLIENQVYEANNRDGTLYKIDDDYYNKNQIQNSENNNNERNEYNEFKNFMSWIYVFLFILFVSFVLYDLVTYVRNKNKENQIDKDYCLLDYNMNNCTKVTAADGNYLNDFCKKKLKCMETIENNLYLTKIFGEMISELFHSVYCRLGISGSVIVSVSLFSLVSLTKVVSWF